MDRGVAVGTTDGDATVALALVVAARRGGGDGRGR